MKRLVIDRSIWLRGEGGNNSYLLREEDGKKCCLGIYLGACGTPDELLSGHVGTGQIVLPEEAKWLDQGADAFMIVNDDPHTPASTRERGIEALFASHGIQVTFVG